MLTLDRLPLLGACVAFRPPGHPVHVLDVVGVDPARLRLADVRLWRAWGSMRVAHFEGWGRTVVAPAACSVVAVHDGEPDRRTVSIVRDAPRVLLLGPLRSRRDLRLMAGNHVLLDIGGHGFLLLAHLRQGTVTVNRGQKLEPGDHLGQVGNSGNSLAPHLHVQAMASTDPFTARTLAWQVSSLEEHVHDRWHASPGVAPLRRPMRSP